ncbi:MAG: glycosyltransferase family 4 protein [Acidobacteria bacterium]|nr:glycosyltransferase family 4 protein [Acidobacteriota bacterium]
MRLAVFGSGHPYRGGVARTTTDLVAILAARGHELLFLTPSRQYPGWLFPGASDRDPDACPKLDCAEPLLDPMQPFSWRSARRRAMEFGADAWIIPYWTWAWAGLWRWLLRPGRPPVIGIAHNPADHGAGVLRRLAARSVLCRCDAIFTHASALEAEVVAMCPAAQTASHPLPPPEIGTLPSREEARKALAIPADRRVALFLGLIRSYKGADLLIEAVARQPEGSDWLLVVAGEPWENLGPELRSRVSGLGIEERVQLRLGWVPESEVPTLLAAADLVVLPYLSGSQSAVAPLALASGLPVLSTRVGGLAEVVRDGVNGVLVEPGSVDELARAFERLDRETLGSLAKGARRSRERLTWRGYAAELEGLLDEVVGTKSEF